MFPPPTPLFIFHFEKFAPPPPIFRFVKEGGRGQSTGEGGMRMSQVEDGIPEQGGVPKHVSSTRTSWEYQSKGENHSKGEYQSKGSSTRNLWEVPEIAGG